MTPEPNIRRIAIVGFGPRGLGALEALAAQSRDTQTTLAVDIFDPHAEPGAGPNFSPDESALCLLNIPVRALHITPLPFMVDRIGSFADWSSHHYAPDDFPPRCDLGAYFIARFKALRDTVAGRIKITHVRDIATDTDRSDEGWMVHTSAATHGPYQDVLLTQGQPATKPDPQMQDWMAHADGYTLPLVPAYPVHNLIDVAKNWSGQTVAVRGLGLSTFDVLRALTSGLGGQFENGSYTKSGREPAKILPFSLNGQPPAAKPATGALDARYDPTKAETRRFTTALDTTRDLSPQIAVQTLCDTLEDPVARILSAHGAAHPLTAVRDWLVQERAAPDQQETTDAHTTLDTFIAMAQGDIAPSIGYAVGQVWRKWQTELRDGFNTLDYAPKTAAAIIAFDNGLKRYSYGPPIGAALELRMLIKQGLVSLNKVDDPDITTVSEGWQIGQGDSNITATVMIDAVLPNPNLTNVTDDLMCATVARGDVEAITDKLGARTDIYGHSVPAPSGLSVLGRLALGSVIAADSLHDCFGQSANRWAKRVISSKDRDPNQPA